MKKFVLSIIAVSTLSACFSDIKTPEPVIDSPPLSLQSDFEQLQTTSTVITLSEDTSQQIMSDVLLRFMNIVEVANQTADLVAVSAYAPPVKFKAARSVYVEDASSDYCNNSDGTSGNAEAAIWDDRDNSQTASAGDVWYYRLQNCQSKVNSAIVTGLIGQTGMEDQFSPAGDSRDVFSNYKYTIDMQIDPQQGKVAYLKNTKLNYSRTDEFNTSMTILDHSLMGVSLSADQPDDVKSFLFDFSESQIKSDVTDEDNFTLEVNFSARYFDSELNGYVDVSTPEKLVFQFTYKPFGSIQHENNPYDTIILLSGSVLLSTGEQVASLSVDSIDETQVEFKFNDNSSTAVSFPQTEYFNTSLDSGPNLQTFSLINISD